MDLTTRAYFPEDGLAPETDRATITLETVCYISKGMVVHSEEEEHRGAFKLADLVSTAKDDVHSKQFVEGKHLDRWVPTASRWLEWGTERAPSQFSRQTFPQIYEAEEKLISVDMAAGTQRLRVVYDNMYLYHNHSAWSFVPWHYLRGVRNKSLKKAARYGDEKPKRDLPRREFLEQKSERFSARYLAAIMNSSLARDFLRANRRSNIHLYPEDWKSLPIADVPEEQQKPLVAVVDRILVAKAQDPYADVSTWEVEIDRLVYELYGLTEAEIQIVEGQ